MKLSVKRVYKLDDDYKNIFINNTANFIAEYTELQLSSRTINKTHYDDIYILEPNSYYRIEFYEEISSPEMLDVSDFYRILMSSGLIAQYDASGPYLYVYNANQNMIYIQQGAILFKTEV